MNEENLITIPEASQSRLNNNLIFQNKKSGLAFAFKATILFLPFLYLLNLWQISPFGVFLISIMQGKQQLPYLYFFSVFTTLLSVGLVTISISLFSKKITSDKFYKFIFLVPLGYLVTITPFLFFNLFIAYLSFYAYFYAYNGIIASLESVLPMVFLGFLIYFWFKFKKVYTIFLYFLGFAILAYYIFTKIIIGGCYYADSSCLSRRALDSRNQQSVNYVYNECEKAQIPGKCYYEVIRNEENPDPAQLRAVCERITDRFYKSSCYVYVAPKLKDISLCDKIDKVKIKNNNRFNPNKEYETREFEDCKIQTNYELALQNSDTSYCDKIYIYSERGGGDCYVAVAVKMNDQQVCDKINPFKDYREGVTKEWCYYNYAVEKKDCSLVPPTPNYDHSKSECHNAIKK